MRTADEYITLYNMLPHPEGGYYTSLHRSETMVQIQEKSPPRNLYSSIYFLFKKDNISAFHRLVSDEIWHWYDGDAIHVFEINQAGKLTETVLGPASGIFQHLIKGDTWFGGNISGARTFALMGCTVHPGFDFNDFEMGERGKLIVLYPQHAQIIQALTFR